MAPFNRYAIFGAMSFALAAPFAIEPSEDHIGFLGVFLFVEIRAHLYRFLPFVEVLSYLA